MTGLELLRRTKNLNVSEILKKKLKQEAQQKCETWWRALMKGQESGQQPPGNLHVFFLMNWRVVPGACWLQRERCGPL